MRPIDADALVEQLSDKAKEMLGIAEQCQGLAINYYEGAKYGFAKAAIIANGFPTIDPAKHGKWNDDLAKRGKWSDEYGGFGRHIYCCSECRNYSPEDFPYCHWCGAKMERSEEC